MSTNSYRRLTLVLVIAVSNFIYSQAQLQVGYTIVTADPGNTLPVGSALFSYTNAMGVLVSQAGVGAGELVFSGRLFVDQAGTETGIALLNPSKVEASVTFILRDSSGNESSARQSQALGAGKHQALFVSQLFPNLPSGFTGSLTFESNQPLAAITLRESRNAQNEPVYATLPIIDLNAQSTTKPLVFPQIAVGEGYLTQVILINTSKLKISGQLTLTGSDGKPLSLQRAGVISSQFSYVIEPDGTYRAELDSPSGLVSGYALVTPDVGNGFPSGTAIFQFKQNKKLVTEAGVGASNSTTLSRIFVDNVNTYTGVALANPENVPASVVFTILDRYGVSVESTTRTIGAKGHLAVFSHELFSGLTNNFTGLMEISSSGAVAAITLKLTVNERNEQVLTTLPVADLTRLSTALSMIFPHIATGEGFSMRLILINVDKGKTAKGKVNFYKSDATPMILPLGDNTQSEFTYEMAAGGGRQLFPGNAAKVASISLLDASSNFTTKEVVVNEGNTVRPTLLVLDSTGTARDDFSVSFASLSPDIATVDSSGSIRGTKAGFSTLTVSSGGVVTTATITVVSLSSGITGFEITGIAQDLARRLYLANSLEHTLLSTEDLKQTPVLYAGVSKTPGLKDDLRKESWFQNPTFLIYNQADGNLYVSDNANHVIRRVQPGPSGRVETLAGTGAKGSIDGPVKQAAFNSPEGLVLDNRGNLWVVDSGNHTIRKINLAAGTVQTVAGKAGSSGWVDGIGVNARFNAPAGIAIESESLAQQLDRESKGLGPPPVRLLVADTGNGALRRIKETGEVETIQMSTEGMAGVGLSRGDKRSAPAALPIRFSAPAGIAVDTFGNIYVTEPKQTQVKVILPNGDTVSAVQSKTFTRPRGIVIAQTGRVLVSDGNNLAQEFTYGAPEITSISPEIIGNKGGETITIKGRSFAPDTIAVISGAAARVKFQDTQTLVLTTPPAPSGLGTLTIQSRAGLMQRSILVEAVPLNLLTPGMITTVAGGTTFAGDGGAATAGILATPLGVTVDHDGSLFIADSRHHRIRLVNRRTGIITTIAGSGIMGSSGDDRLANTAKLSNPNGIALDAAGNLFLADGTHRIRRIDSITGIITTVAGTGEPGYSGDNGPAGAARLQSPSSLAIDGYGNLYIADRDNHRIRKVEAGTGIITTLAGTGVRGFSGENGQAASAQLASPEGIAVDPAGGVFIADTGNHRIRRVRASTGVIYSIAGNGVGGFSGDNGPAGAAQLRSPAAVALHATGYLIVADRENHRIRRIDLATGIITTVAGRGQLGFSGDGGLATDARLATPSCVALDAAGNLVIADSDNHRIRRVEVRTSVITTMAGGVPEVIGDGGKATGATLAYPRGVAVDFLGTLFIADAGHNRIRKVDQTTSVITSAAGNGGNGFAGDNGPAINAMLNNPRIVVLDNVRNLLISDSDNQRVRRVAADTGTISTIAGSGMRGFSGDNGSARAAQVATPYGIAVDKSGNLFIADKDNHRIRKVTSTTGIISTVAGNGQPGFSGDDGQATAAQLNGPYGIALDTTGNLYIADTSNQRVRKVDAATGIIRTVAGNGKEGLAGDNGLATEARLANPRAVAIDAEGNLFIADTDNHRIRKVSAATGLIVTVAGSTQGFSGDNGPATSARLLLPYAVAIDSAGDLFIVDTINHRIRAVRGPIP